MSTYHFKTNAQLKSILGKELINNDNIAILELVKNSFDAGSRKVIVSFLNIVNNDDERHSTYGENSSKIIIKDYGVGMALEDIEQRWLNIAYSDKKIKKEQFGRVQAGNKGIGRFSCDRLGRFLDIYTRRSGGSLYHLSIDWADFEKEGNPDTKIESIDVQVRKMVGAAAKEYSDLKHGTIIEVSRLRSPWNEDKLVSLRRYLERLINPNQKFSDTQFSLYIQAKEFGKNVNGEIENQIFERLDFTSTAIESEISSDGTQVSTKLTDKGRAVLELVEDNNDFKMLKGVKVVIYYLNPYGKGYFKRMTGLHKVDFGSIFLFINGFRVAPYGEQKDDWLGLDRHKVQAYGRNLGSREVVGRIEIDDAEGDYKIISSREGIVRDDRVEQLITRPDGFYYHTHRRLERYVVDGLDWDKIPEEEMLKIQAAADKEWKFNPRDEIYSLNEREKNLKILETLNAVLGSDSAKIKTLKIHPDIISELAKAEKERADRILSEFNDFTPAFGRSTRQAVEEVRKVMARQKRVIERQSQEHVALHARLNDVEKEAERVSKENLFLRAATTAEDRGMAGLQHQIGFSAGRVAEKLKELRRSIEAGKPVDVLNKILAIISFENRKIQIIANYVTKARFSMVREELPNENMVQFIKQYIENVYALIPDAEGGAKMEVTVEAPAEGSFKRTFSPLEAVMLVDNLLDNSRKAKATLVRITMKKEADGGLTVSFRDNGTGIDTRYVERIFDFGFTTTNGAGIGLYHVRQIVKKLGGNIICSPVQGRGAEFIITLPK